MGRTSYVLALHVFPFNMRCHTFSILLFHLLYIFLQLKCVVCVSTSITAQACAYFLDQSPSIEKVNSDESAVHEEMVTSRLMVSFVGNTEVVLVTMVLCDECQMNASLFQAAEINRDEL